MRLHHPCAFLCVLLTLASARAQEASSEIVGFWEAQVAPGTFEPLAPLLLPLAEGSGRVDGVIDAGRITPGWFGSLPDPVDTAVWWPRRGIAAGRTLFGSPVESTSDWTYASIFRGTSFAGPAEDSLLKVGDPFAVIPLWTVEELVGRADASGVHAAATQEAADVVTFPGGTLWAAQPEGETARWVVSTSQDPASDDAGGSVIQDVNQPIGYRRSSQATAARLLTFSGTPRITTAAFPIEPTPADAVNPVWNPVLRPDGRGFTLASPLGLLGRSASSGLVGGRTAATADRLVIWSPDIQAWEEFYYQTVAPVGWKSLRGRPVNPSIVRVPAGAVFYVIRPASLPRIVLRLPSVSPAVLVNRSLFRQIVDRDRDRLADGWERAHGSADLSMLPGVDLDGDGLTNLSESLLGGDPRVFDAPGRPVVQVRSVAPGSREVWLTVTAPAGCRYRIQKLVAGATAWTQLGSLVIGDGQNVEVRDPVPLSPGERIPRFYRALALTPADSDGDLLSDWEERNVYGSDPAKRDTDLDGTTDGAEARTQGRDALDYYDGRAVALTIDRLTNGQVTPPGQWVRQAIAFQAAANKRPLVNAPVTFTITRGDGLLSLVAGDDAGASRTLSTRTDSKGMARVFVKAGTSPGRIEGSVSARVKGPGTGGGGLVQLYSGSWVCHCNANLTLPATGLVRWFRPDHGVTVFGSGGQVTSWQSVAGGASAVATATNDAAPRRVSEQGWTWMQFTGKEKMDLGAVLPDNVFNAYFVAAPSGNRTPVPASASAPGVEAGAKGQCYLLAGETLPGQRILVYDAPARPAPRTFSTWEQTDFRFHPDYLDGPSGEEYWRWTRPYNFPVGPARYDATTGYRITPAPEGIQRRLPTSTIYSRFLASTGRHFANFLTTYEATSTKNTTYLGRVIAEERFFEVRATSWRGNSSSPAFGGIPRMDYAKLGDAGFGLSVGAQTSGAFELAQYWKPAVSAPAAHSAASGAMPKAAILASVRLNNRIPAIDIGGQRRATGSSALSRSTLVEAPRFLGGWDSSGNGYQGKLGDLLLYDRDLSDEERRTVEDVLASAYRGVFIADRDRDGLRDWWERTFIGNSTGNASGDLDGDLSSNLEEQTWGTDPASQDTDGDGLTDKAELTAKTNALTWDTDFDFLGDAVDSLPRDPRNGRADANSNGIPDGIDALLANRSLVDTDGDGLCDLVEAGWLLTSAILADTDGDSVNDGDEVLAGTDPRVP